MSQQSPQQQQAQQQQQPSVPAMDPNAAPQPYMGPGPMGHAGAPGGPPFQQHGHHAQAQAQAVAAAAAGVTPVYGVPNAMMSAQGQQQQQQQLQQQHLQQQGQGQYYGQQYHQHQAAPPGYPPMASMADYAAHGMVAAPPPGVHPHAVLPPHMQPGGVSVQHGGHAGGHHAGAGGPHSHSDATKKRRRFSQSEKDAVIKGVAKFGPGQWKAIKNSAPAVLHQRTTVQIKDCYRTMLKRGDIPPDLGDAALKKLAQSKAEKLAAATGGGGGGGGGGGAAAPPYDAANPPPRRGKRKFTQEEKDAILNGVVTKGYGNWEDIRQQYFDVLGSRSSLQLKDCYRTMVKLGQAAAIKEDDDTKRERKRRFAARARDAKRRKKAAADAEYNNGGEEGAGQGQQGGPPSAVHIPPPATAAAPDGLPQEPVDGQVPQVPNEAADAEAAAYADAQEAVADAIDHAEEAAAAAEAAASEAIMEGGGEGAPAPSPEKAPPVREDEPQGGDDADADADADGDDSTYSTEEDYYLWPNLWRRLERRGWTQVRAGRQHRTLDWLYVLPGCDGRTGTLGTDFFGSEQDVVEYVKSTDPYDAAKNKKSGGGDGDDGGGAADSISV